MTIYSSIRGDFIRACASEHTNYHLIFDSITKNKNRELCLLNQKYGFIEEAGYYHSKKKSSDPIYINEYSEIEKRFPTNHLKINKDRFLNSPQTTIFEYLLIENIAEDILINLAKESEKSPDYLGRFINIKANLTIEYWSSKYAIGGIRRMIDMEIKNHHYAEHRCRRHMNIKTWHFIKQRTIFDYRREWKIALEEAFHSFEIRPRQS